MVSSGALSVVWDESIFMNIHDMLNVVSSDVFLVDGKKNGT